MTSQLCHAQGNYRAQAALCTEGGCAEYIAAHLAIQLVALWVCVLELHQK